MPCGRPITTLARSRHGPRCGASRAQSGAASPQPVPSFRSPIGQREGQLALPTHECGLEVIALVGTLRHAQHRRVPEMHQEVARRRRAIAPRTVLPRLERDDALGALSWAEPLRLQRVTTTHGRVLLALDGLHPDVGHAGLWIWRDGLSAAVLLARSRLSATQEDLADLLRAVQQALRVPLVGVISEGQSSIRCAVAPAWPNGPHQRCHCHSLREAATPVYAADRPAKKALQKPGRGGRPLERQRDKRPDPAAEGLRGECSAVRRALTDDGPPPRRLGAHALRPASRARHKAGADRTQGAAPQPLVRLQTLLQRGVTKTASRWPEVRGASRGGHRAAHVLTNEAHRTGAAVKRRLGGLRGALTQHRAAAGALAPALAHCLKVSRSDWPGLFYCSAVPELPRTNNALEPCVGAHRSHERRATGRQGASPALVLRGAVQLLAARATRLRGFAAWERAPEEGSDWTSLRHARDTRRQRRILRRRFRRNPDASLMALEAALLKLTLPP